MVKRATIAMLRSAVVALEVAITIAASTSGSFACLAPRTPTTAFAADKGDLDVELFTSRGLLVSHPWLFVTWIMRDPLVILMPDVMPGVVLKGKLAVKVVSVAEFDIDHWVSYALRYFEERMGMVSNCGPETGWWLQQFAGKSGSVSGKIGNTWLGGKRVSLITQNYAGPTM